jgi:hypothetical protein
MKNKKFLIVNVKTIGEGFVVEAPNEEEAIRRVETSWSLYRDESYDKEIDSYLDSEGEIE